VTAADPFFGQDAAYFKEEQYRDSSNLTPRWILHEEYSTASVPWFEWVALQVEWQRGAQVLEMGCGPGLFWERAQAILPRLHVTLTDLSRGMVDEALARTRTVGHHFSINAAVVDAQSVPFDDGAFDVVLADHMLYHVPDPRRAVAEAARVLVPGGVFIAGTNGPRHLHELMRIRTGVFGGVASTESHAAIFGPENGLAMLRECFDSVVWVPYPDELACTNPADVLAYLTSFPPAQGASPEERHELEDAIDGVFDAGDGVFRITKESGVFVAA
jgi:SAM-dependent methyltransferase